MLKRLFTNYQAMKYKYSKVKCTEDECVICTDPIHNEYVPRFVCNHMFHSKCIQKWMKINKYCPICRKDLSIVHLRLFYEEATVKDIHTNIHIITDILKHIYVNSSKRAFEIKSDVILMNDLHITYWEMTGRFNIWNETKPEEKVTICILYKKKLYSIELNTLNSYQCNEGFTYDCVCKRRQIIKIVLDTTFSRIDVHKTISFLLSKKN